MKIKKINDIKIKPLKFSKIELPIKGADLFDGLGGLYSNIFLLAKKRSGKSTVIYNILKNCAGRDTKIYIFCSTVNKDESYKKIMDYLDKKNIYYEAYTAISEDNINNLSEIIDELKANQNEGNETIKEETKEEPKKNNLLDFGDKVEEEKKERKPRKLKYIAPENIFIFDDLGQLLRDPMVEQLLKTNRHYKSKVILSSQYLNDLKPASRLNLDYLLIWGGQPEEKLKIIHKDIDIATDLNNFLEIYEEATSEKYNFLYIDIRAEKYRKNFNEEILL